MAQSVKPVHCEHKETQVQSSKPMLKAKCDSTYLFFWCWGSGDSLVDQRLACVVTSMYVHLHMSVHLHVNKHGHSWRSDEVMEGALKAHKRRDWYKLSACYLAPWCAGHSRVPIAIQIFLTAFFHSKISQPLRLWMNEPPFFANYSICNIKS